MWMTRSLSFSSSIFSIAILQSLELEPGFARGFGQGLDAAVVEVAVAVEHDLLDLLLEADLRDQRADLLGAVGLVVFAERVLQVAGQRGSCGQRLAVVVDHDLRVDVAAGAEHAETRTLRRATDLAANAELAALPTRELGHGYL